MSSKMIAAALARSIFGWPPYVVCAGIPGLQTLGLAVHKRGQQGHG